MTRTFDPERAVEPERLARLVEAGARAPSAGKAQGWHLVVLEGAETARFWDRTLPPERRAGFAWPGLLHAPVVALPLADAEAYVSRYAEPDKAATGLGRSAAAWPVPYWTAEAAALGTLFFGVFRGEAELRADLGIPDRLQLLGAIAIGWPSPRGAGRAGASARRPRRPVSEIVHRGGW
jgi:nitroreductase